ncbi:MAG TPA: DNA-directed RNA polymerase [Candidatus Nanoarchaeia archaeon]|nr:DNA-directed RNA polymerase [Candidatus Nanoarchaeia archaeon]
MFYKSTVHDHVRVPPNLFGMESQDAIIKVIRREYSAFISRDIGIVIDVLGIKTLGEGIIIPGDGASYYDTVFELLAFKPEMQEVVVGKIRDIADFGAFLNLGPIEGMIHISQTMDDFVSFSKEKVLTGKETKRILRVGDTCRARIIAVSYKDINNPKLGLTMRQPGLGKLEWVEEDSKKEIKDTKEIKKEIKKEKKPEKRKK